MRHVLLISLLSIGLSAVGQNAIRGKIIDGESGIAVPFATIRLVGSHDTYGLITNTDGSFQIPIRYKSIIDTLVISCIGYINKKIPISELEAEKMNLIKLNESVTSLSEIIIKGKQEGRLTSTKIVQNAIDRISYNYPFTPSSYIAYYRDYQLKENQYVNLNEAIVELFDPGFISYDYDSTRISLLDYKNNIEFERDSLIEIPYDNNQRQKFIPGATISPTGGNELAILRIHDAIRNYKDYSYSFVGVFNKNFIDNHKFFHFKTVYLNNTSLYKIAFESKLLIAGSGHIARGNIYIERSNFAIHKLEYNVFEKDQLKLNSLYSINVEYVRNKSLMHLNYISFNNFFKVKNRDDFLVKDILFDMRAHVVQVTFTHQPELKSAQDPKNYHFQLIGNELKIDRIEFNMIHNIAFIYLKYNPKKSLKENQISRVVTTITGIKDLHGREVNKPTFTSVNQFRELFVQKPTQSTPSEDLIWIHKNLPMNLNPIQPKADLSSSSYWMNTPLKKN